MGLLRYSVELYRSLEAETGQPVGYHQTGSLRLAQTRDRLDEFAHVAGVAELLDVPFEVVTAERASELFPLMDTGGVTGAAHLPTDGWIDPTSLANAYAKGATDRGATIHRHTPVTGIARGRAGWCLGTPRGEVRAGTVVLAAGQWSRELARLAGARLPIVSMPHHYVITDPVDGLRAGDDTLPVLRDPDASFYARQDNEGLLVGPFEQDVEPVGARTGSPRASTTGSCARSCSGSCPRSMQPRSGSPCSAETAIRKTINGPDAYTPDGRCLMGPVPGLRDFHVLTGFSIFGIVFVRRRRALRSRVDRRRPAARQHVGARRPPLRRLRGNGLHGAPRHARSTSASTTSTTRRRSGRPGGR